jgi:virulence plasmid B protein
MALTTPKAICSPESASSPLVSGSPAGRPSRAASFVGIIGLALFVPSSIRAQVSPVPTSNGPAQDYVQQGMPVESSSGDYRTSIPIRVPPFHGLEPKLALEYDSSAGNGQLGVGWHLAGFSTIQRSGPNKTIPHWDSTDVYVLDGEPLVSSTILGGNYATKRQSFRQISFNGSSAFKMSAFPCCPKRMLRGRPSFSATMIWAA